LADVGALDQDCTLQYVSIGEWINPQKLEILALQHEQWLQWFFWKGRSVDAELRGSFIERLQSVHHLPVFTLMIEFPERLEWNVHLCKLQDHQKFQSLVCESSKPVRPFTCVPFERSWHPSICYVTYSNNNMHNSI
jgi:hypothetical protein